MPSLSSLPDEILLQIFEELPGLEISGDQQQTLRHLRFVNWRFNVLATALVFEHIRIVCPLKSTGCETIAKRIANLKNSPLLEYVKGLTIGTGASNFGYHTSGDVQQLEVLWILLGSKISTLGFESNPTEHDRYGSIRIGSGKGRYFWAIGRRLSRTPSANVKHLTLNVQDAGELLQLYDPSPPQNWKQMQSLQSGVYFPLLQTFAASFGNDPGSSELYGSSDPHVHAYHVVGMLTDGCTALEAFSVSIGSAKTNQPREDYWPYGRPAVPELFNFSRSFDGSSVKSLELSLNVRLRGGTAKVIGTLRAMPNLRDVTLARIRIVGHPPSDWSHVFDYLATLRDLRRYTLDDIRHEPEGYHTREFYSLHAARKDFVSDAREENNALDMLNTVVRSRRVSLGLPEMW